MHTLTCATATRIRYGYAPIGVSRACGGVLVAPMLRGWHEFDDVGLTRVSECTAADAPPVLASRLHPVAAATPPMAKTDVALAAVEESTFLGNLPKFIRKNRNGQNETRTFEQCPISNLDNHNIADATRPPEVA